MKKIQENLKIIGNAELIRYTQDPEQVIALAAKLCYSEDSPDELQQKIACSDTAKFITMLKKMGHLSTFEHASFTFSITSVSRALLAQITRHRIASFSVRSQRYVSESQFEYVIPPSIMDLGEKAVEKFKVQMAQMAVWYSEWQEALGGKCESSNEDARFVLPNACQTNMLVTMNARELLHFLALRCCYRAQWEIRDIAWQMLAELKKVAPNVFNGAGPGCVSGICPEGSKTCGRAKEIREKIENENRR
ncbi:MAG: FAD-dependent thymidylate synthase [Firmicutes bacterium]|nr:FAD-dependent thymidylate synthase [Bacillota bacterium]